jgi:transposase
MEFVGIDVGAENLYVAIALDPDKRRFKTSSFSNDSAGQKKLVCWVRKHTQAPFICMESTGYLSQELGLYLHEEGLKVAIVNPRKSRHFYEALGQKNKNDKVDAQTLALFGYRMRPEVWNPPSRNIRELKRLCRRITQLKQERVREKNRLKSLPREDKLTRKSIRRNIHFLDKEIKILEGEIDKFIELGDEDKKEKVSARGMREGESGGESEGGEEKRKKVLIENSEESIAEAIRLISTIPGIKKTTATRIVLELVGKEFESARSMASYVGVIPSAERSGKSVAKRGKMDKKGNVHIRTALFMPSLSAFRAKAWRGIVRRLEARHKEKRVIRGALMRKLVHAIFGVLKYKSPFEPEKILGTI